MLAPLGKNPQQNPICSLLADTLPISSEMASSSLINTLSPLCSCPSHNIYSSHRFVYNPIVLPKNPLFIHRQLQRISLKPLRISSLDDTQFPKVPQMPTSIASTIDKFSTLCSKNLVIFLVGSFIFLGSFNSKVVFAVPSQQSCKIEKMEGTAEARVGESGNEEMYRKLLEENPRDVEALKVIFNEKMRRGKTKEAVEYVERLIDVQPGEVEWRLLQALCYEMMGQFSKAKRLFKDLLVKRPLLLRALHGLAMVMHKNHEDAAVFEMLNKALELARREKRVTEERNIRILIAQMHVVKGDLEESLKQFQALVYENPRDFRPYLCQGIVYSLLDKKKEAEEQFDIYRSLVPDEFPQRGFLDDVVLAAKNSSRQQLQEEFRAEYSYKN